MPEVEEDSYEKARKSVLWVSSIVLAEMWLGINLSASISALDGIKYSAIALVFLLVLGYLIYRLYQYSHKEDKFRWPGKIYAEHKYDVDRMVEAGLAKEIQNIYNNDKFLMNNFNIDPTPVEKDEYNTTYRARCLALLQTIDGGYAAAGPNGDVDRHIKIPNKIIKANLIRRMVKNCIHQPEWVHTWFPFVLGGLAMLALLVKALGFFPIPESRDKPVKVQVISMPSSNEDL